jgi:hypothetical protein
VHHVFGGYQRSQVVCGGCSSASRRYEAALDLQLEVPAGVDRLEDVLARHTAGVRAAGLDGGGGGRAAGGGMAWHACRRWRFLQCWCGTQQVQPACLHVQTACSMCDVRPCLRSVPIETPSDAWQCFHFQLLRERSTMHVLTVHVHVCTCCCVQMRCWMATTAMPVTAASRGAGRHAGERAQAVLPTTLLASPLLLALVAGVGQLAWTKELGKLSWMSWVSL